MKPFISPEFRSALARTMLSDRHWLRRTWESLPEQDRALFGSLRPSGNPAETPALADGGNGLNERFLRRLSASQQRYTDRAAHLPALSYPAELPISSRQAEIVDAIRQHQALIICGETGSGKSTQLPKMCLAAGLGVAGMIGHTQPRRIAARSVASRLAEELQTSVGRQVGFKVRFSDQTAPETLIKLMTDGMLLAETPHDRFLTNYECIIVDEAHERSLNIDFLMGYLRRLLDKRRDLKVIITSATIDATRFAEHFSMDGQPAPILEVSGRGYPVEIRYRPPHGPESLQSDAPNPVAAKPSSDSSNSKRRKPNNAQPARQEPTQELTKPLLSALDELIREGPGDILVFLPTERDIREQAHRIQGHFKRKGLQGTIDTLPLYARLTVAEQNRVFQVGNKRRVVLATNVAESSLTVPGIHYVIDSGTARISRYSPRSKVQRLPIEEISRASADQRAGRCGRIAPGICIRLYSAEDYLTREAFTTPEIRRTNLASVLLQALVLNLGPLEKFPLLDPPREDQIREGFKTLRELQAIDDRRQLTPLGRQLGHLPIDPRIGRMILEAHERNCLEEVVVIAAALEAQDPRDRPPDRKEQADQAHLPFQDQRSDFVAFLKVWQFYHLLKAKLSNSQLKKACQQQFLSQVRLREWSDLARQLYTVANVVKRKSQPGTKSKQPTSRDVAFEKKPALVINLPPDGSVDDRRYAAIHQSLLTGLLSGVAMAGEKHTYQGAGGLELFLWPGSGVFAGKPKWIVAAELVETSRRYARTVAKIDPEWLEPLAAHLIKRNYSDPHWSKKRYMALCSERLLLFGLPVVAKRLVPLAPVDPESARELLIEHGLVDGELETRARFFQHNQFLQRSLGELAARMRKRELVVDPYTVRRFYFERLPSQCVGRIELEQLDRQLPAPSWTKALSDVDRIAKWLETPPAIPNDAADAAATQLYMRPEDLLPQATAKVAPSDFPETLEVGGCELPLSYNFAPGAPDDGITVKVPAAALAQVSDDRLGWLVPGLLEEKITALIKALPKRIRRNLVPAADVAKRVCKQLTAEQGQTPFMTSVCRQLSALAEMPVQASDFEVDKLPPHVQFLVQVIDDGGQTIASGRSVDELKAQLGATTATSTGEVIDTGPDPAGLTREGLTNFEIDELPELVTRVRGGVKVNLYPALVDTGPNVAVRLFDSPSSAEEATRKGLMRLFVLTERKELRSQVQWLPQREQAQMLLARAFGGRDFNEVMIDLLARLAFVGNEPLARTRDDFEVRRKDRGRRINGASQDLGKWLPEIAQAYHALRLRMESLTHARYAAVMDDVQAQLAGLLSTETFESATWDWLKHIPRYLKGIDYRLDKLRSGGEAKDRANLEVVRNLQVKYEQRRQDTRADLNQLTEVRWLFEELRISLFAQPLGTAHKASPQRIEKMLT